jgi:hypothetical protein
MNFCDLYPNLGKGCGIDAAGLKEVQQFGAIPLRSERVSWFQVG